jgi:hypothetical protein
LSNGLTVGSTTSLEGASNLARRTMTQIEEIRLRQAKQARPAATPSRPARSSPPSVDDASREDFDAASEWIEKVGLATIGDELIRLIGEVNVDLAYDHGDPMVTLTPSLHALRALASEARDLARRWQRPAPIGELEVVGERVREALESVAWFHDQQVSMFGLLTPQTFEDGTFPTIAAEVQSKYQPLIETMAPPARGLFEALDAVNHGLGRALRT